MNPWKAKLDGGCISRWKQLRWRLTVVVVEGKYLKWIYKHYLKWIFPHQKDEPIVYKFGANAGIIYREGQYIPGITIFTLRWKLMETLGNWWSDAFRANFIDFWIGFCTFWNEKHQHLYMTIKLSCLITPSYSLRNHPRPPRI